MERQRRAIEAEGIREFEDNTHVSFLKWRAMEATEHLAASPNTKIVVMGTGQGQLPVLLNTDEPAREAPSGVAKVEGIQEHAETQH
jgi:hypothetical protein